MNITSFNRIQHNEAGLVEVLTICLQAMDFHLKMTKKMTGEITEDDILYCINMTRRIIKNYKGKTL